MVETKQTISNKIELLIDTGSDLNLIKLNHLDPTVLVDKTIRYNLTGINTEVTQTLGKVSLTVHWGHTEVTTDFHVVHPNFHILKEGILGKPFFKENQQSINFKTNQVILADNHKQEIPP